MRYENVTLNGQVCAVIGKLDDLQAQRNKLQDVSRHLPDCEPEDFAVYKKQISEILDVIEDINFELAVKFAEVEA